MKSISNRNLLLLAVLFGVINWAAWPARGFAPLLFASWLPLLFIENKFFENGNLKKRKLFGLLYLSFFLWNVMTTWWIYYSTFFGAVMAIGLNSLFMSLVFLLWHFFHVRAKSDFSYATLPALWITWEYFHLDWDLSWPWLTLGNGFAAYTKLIQWYEYTGVFGGGLWMLASNILLFLFFKNRESMPSMSRKLFMVWMALIAIPILISNWIYISYKEKESPVNIAIVQPNIDPYNEKFDGMPVDVQLNRLLTLADKVVDSGTDYLICPETAIPSGVWENELKENDEILSLKAYLAKHKNLTLIIGASTYMYYGNDSAASSTVRYRKQAGYYYDSFNTAFQITENDSIQVHHKSKLVPGVEMMPFPKLMMPLQEFAFDLGGMVGSLGTQKTPSVFSNDFGSNTRMAPIICYESIYGEYVSKYVNSGANMLAIITNDGWWDDSPGYRQHLQYGRLRAIEMRRSIARSANTGISAFINQRGDVSQATGWWVQAAIKQTINKNEAVTFYAKHGDYIATVFKWLSLILILMFPFLKFIRR